MRKLTIKNGNIKSLVPAYYGVYFFLSVVFSVQVLGAICPNGALIPAAVSNDPDPDASANFCKTAPAPPKPFPPGGPAPASVSGSNKQEDQKADPAAAPESNKGAQPTSQNGNGTQTQGSNSDNSSGNEGGGFNVPVIQDPNFNARRDQANEQEQIQNGTGHQREDGPPLDSGYYSPDGSYGVAGGYGSGGFGGGYGGSSGAFGSISPLGIGGGLYGPGYFGGFYSGNTGYVSIPGSAPGVTIPSGAISAPPPVVLGQVTASDGSVWSLEEAPAAVVSQYPIVNGQRVAPEQIPVAKMKLPSLNEIAPARRINTASNENSIVAGATLPPIQKDALQKGGSGDSASLFFDNVQRGTQVRNGESVAVISAKKASDDPVYQVKSVGEKSSESPKSNIQIDNNVAVNNTNGGNGGYRDSNKNGISMAQYYRRLSAGNIQANSGNKNDELNSAPSQPGLAGSRSNLSNGDRELASVRGPDLQEAKAHPGAIVAVLLSALGIALWQAIRMGLIPKSMRDPFRGLFGGEGESPAVNIPVPGQRPVGGFEPTNATSATRISEPSPKDKDLAPKIPKGFMRKKDPRDFK